MPYRWFLVIIFFCAGEINLSSEAIDDKNEITLNEIEAKLTSLTNSFTEWAYPVALEMMSESNISLQCSLSYLRFFTDIRKLKEWALRMFDASAKFLVGTYEGTMVMFGDYDECLDINVMNSRNKTVFKGKYCMVEFHIPENVFLKINALNITSDTMLAWKLLHKFKSVSSEIFFGLGVCVPSKCAAQEINQIAQFVASTIGLLTDVKCEIRTEKKPNIEQTAFLCCFAVLGLLVITGTIVDLMKRHTNNDRISGELKKLIMAFSLYSNTARLFRTAQYNSSLLALRGVRVLTSFWIILGHVYFFPNHHYFVKYGKRKRIMEIHGELLPRTLTSGGLAMDTFLLLSGMLFVYTTWKKLEEGKGWINYVVYFPLRMARLLPSEALVIALLMVLPLFGDGPLWNETFKPSYAACKNDWWKNLLFIQNFWPMEEICLFHSWFLGVLFQLFLLALPILPILSRWPKIGISVNVLLIITGCFVTGLLTSVYNLPSHFTLLELNLSKLREYYMIIYGLPYTYVCSYCIGILLGYAIVNQLCPEIKPWKRFSAWLMATFGVLVVIYGPYFMDSRSVLHIAYAAMHRTVWSVCISWIIFACLNGYGGIIGSLLSLKVMIPLDRLTYLLYLLHPLVLLYQTARTRTVIYFSHVEQVYIFLSTVVISVGLSYFFNVTFEQPISYFQSFIVRKLSKKPFPDIMPPATVLSLGNKLTPLSDVAITPVDSRLEENVSKL